MRWSGGGGDTEREAIVGQRVRVYWPGDDRFCAGVVQGGMKKDPSLIKEKHGAWHYSREPLTALHLQYVCI